MPTGLGDELIWISPTITGSGPASDITGGNTVTEQGTVSNVYDSTEGGKRALSVSSAGDQFYFDWPYITAGNIETFSFWIKKSVLNLTYGYWKIQNGNDSHDAGNWNISDYGTAFGFFGIGSFSLGSQIPANDWTNVIITRDDTASGQQTTIYVDNVQVFQGNTSIGNRYRDQITRIGITSDITTTAEVRFDDVRIFDRIITASERTHLATRRGILGPPAKGLGDEKLWLCPSLQDSANDLSKGNNNGTYNGGMGTISDSSKGGSRCYNFDGIDDYIDCGNAIAPTTGYSASAWVNVTSFPTGTNVETIIEKGYDGTDEPFSFNFRTPTVMRSYTYDGTLHGVTNYVHGMSTGVWYHVATTFDGATWKLFIDGVEVATVNDGTALIQNNLNTYVGASFITSSVQRFLDAKLDDVRLFYRALTQSEITHLASSRGVQGHPTIKGLGDEKLWLCPSLNDSANDISGNGNDGTLNGGMSIVTDVDPTYKGTKAFEFDGIDDYIQCSGPLGNTGSFSLSMWVNRSSSISQRQTVAAQYDNSPANRYWYVEQKTFSTGNQFGTYPTASTTAGRVDTENTYTLNTGTWYHLTAVYDATAGEQRLYINGTLVDSDASTGFQATTIGLTLGSLDGLLPWAGKLDDVRQYERAITQEEITHLAKSRAVSGSPYNLNGIKHLLSSFIHPLG